MSYLISSYVISDNYSVLNNYSYPGKDPAISTLDFLSAPLRKGLGGRSVNVISQTFDYPSSTAARVAMIVFSLLVTPIFLLAATCLLLKVVSGAHIWQQRLVKEESVDAWSIINQFNRALSSADLNKAINIIAEHPHLSERSDIQDSLFKLVNQKMNEVAPGGASWVDIQPVMRLLNKASAITLINHGVKVRFEREVKENLYTLQAEDIIKLVEAAFGINDFVSTKTCYKQLFDNALKIPADTDTLDHLLKIELADGLLLSLNEKASQQNDVLDQVKAIHENSALRWKLAREYGDTFVDESTVRNIRTAINTMRLISQHSLKTRERLKTLQDSPRLSSRQKCEGMSAKLSEFQLMLGRMQYLGTAEQVTAIQTLFSNMIAHINGLSTLTSVEDVEQFQARLASDTASQEAHYRLISVPSSSPRDPLSFLSLKNRANVLMFTMKMRSELLEEIVKAVFETVNSLRPAAA